MRIRKNPLNRNFFIFLAFLFSSSPSFGTQLAQNQSHLKLTEIERTDLRTRLENLYNEVDLVIRNHRADLSDIRRQEQTLAALKVFDRIPFERDYRGLEKELKASSQLYPVKWIRFKKLGESKSAPLPPQSIFTHSENFRLTSEQLIEKLFFQIEVENSPTEWIRSWNSNVMRLVELDQTPRPGNKPNTWIIKAHAFRFRKTKFPDLKPRSPRDLLPQWAKKDPSIFSESEPLLWSFVTRAESLIPKTTAGYQARSRFFSKRCSIKFLFL